MNDEAEHRAGKRHKPSWTPTREARTHVAQGGHDDDLRKSCFELLGIKTMVTDDVEYATPPVRPRRPPAIKPPSNGRTRLLKAAGGGKVAGLSPQKNSPQKRLLRAHSVPSVSLRLFVPLSPPAAAEVAFWRARLTELTMPAVQPVPCLTAVKEKELVHRLVEESLARERETMRITETMLESKCPKWSPLKTAYRSSPPHPYRTPMFAPMTKRQEALLKGTRTTTVHAPSFPKKAKWDSGFVDAPIGPRS